MVTTVRRSAIFSIYNFVKSLHDGHSFKKYMPISKLRMTRDTYSKIEGKLTVNVGDLIRSSSGLGICELSELRGSGGLHFCTARAETRALKRAIEVLFGSVINYFVMNYLEVKVA